MTSLYSFPFNFSVPSFLYYAPSYLTHLKNLDTKIWKHKYVTKCKIMMMKNLLFMITLVFHKSVPWKHSVTKFKKKIQTLGNYHLNNIMKKIILLRDHPFSTYAIFSKKLTFVIFLYKHVHVRVKGEKMLVFPKILSTY